MRRSAVFLLPVTAGLLSGCTLSGPGNLRVHEVLLYGGSQERLVWVYGALGSGPSNSFKVNDRVLELRTQNRDAGGQDALALPGTLNVGGGAVYRLPSTVVAQKLSVTRQAGNLFVAQPSNAGEVTAIYYTDGQSWTKLSGTSGTVRGSAVQGLQGAGNLTAAEAGALSRVLLGQGSLTVAVLSEAGIPDAPLKIEPAPTEYKRTALYILPNVPSVLTAPGTGNAGTSTPSIPGGNVTFTELASGTQSTAGRFGVRVAATQAEASALYAQAYGRQSSIPAAASVGADTLVGVFLGQRPTGGYGIKVLGVQASGSALTVTVQVRAPGPGSITTQALTSPWTIIRVPGRFTTVTVVDERGRPVQDTSAPGTGNDR